MFMGGKISGNCELLNRYFFLQTMLLLNAINSISFYQRNTEAAGLGDAAKRSHLQILGKPQNVSWSSRCQCLACCRD